MAQEDLTGLKFVGPATAETLAAADIDADDVANRRVSHAQLVDAGVNPGVAAKIRREFSLPWSFESGQDLDRRAEQVRGLGDEERAWVAASSGDWEDADAEPASTDGSGSAAAAEAAWRDHSWPGDDRDEDDAAAAEVAWREGSKPTPTIDLDEVSAADASLLARAGITSVRSLATADPERVADSLEIDEDRVRQWRAAARDHESKS